MIDKIGILNAIKVNGHTKNKEKATPNEVNNAGMTNPVVSYNSQHAKANFAPSFGLRIENGNDDIGETQGLATPGEKLDQMIKEGKVSQEAIALLNKATELAKEMGHPETSFLHVYAMMLDSLHEYGTELYERKAVHKPDANNLLPTAFSMLVGKDVFSTTKMIERFMPTLDEECVEIDNAITLIIEDESIEKSLYTGISDELASAILQISETTIESNKERIEEIKKSKELMNDQLTSETKAEFDHAIKMLEDRQKVPTGVDTLISTYTYSAEENNVLEEWLRPFIKKIKNMGMVDYDKEMDYKVYDRKSQDLLAHLSLGKDMMLQYVDEDNKHSMVANLKKVFNDPKLNKSNMRPDNTDLVILPQDLSIEEVVEKIREAETSKNKSIVVVDFQKILTNLVTAHLVSKNKKAEEIDFSPLFTLKEREDYVRLLLVTHSSGIDADDQLNIFKHALNNHGEITYPQINAEYMKKALLEKPQYLSEKFNMAFEPSAIKLLVDFAAERNGVFPEKAMKVFKEVSLYFEDEALEAVEKNLAEIEARVQETGEEIEEELQLFTVGLKEAKKYISIAESINSKKTDEPFKLVFNTGKKLKDIVGIDMTKAEAQSIVNQIKKGTIGTKGFIVFSPDESGGEKQIVEAIAGETKSPMITIKSNLYLPEIMGYELQFDQTSTAKMNKVFSALKDQAEASPNKTAILYIENFEMLAADPLYGISGNQRQTAIGTLEELMSEVQEENKKKDPKDRLNILVMGSTKYPFLINKDLQKPKQFMDSIAVYSPASRDYESRATILNYHIKNQKIKIAGSTPEEKATVINNIAKSTSGFSVTELEFLLERALSVSKERGHKAVDKSDFTEAFLQVTMGRPASESDSRVRKELVTSHECGHATNLQVLYDIAKVHGKEWHLPDVVDFITLDPRGYFGGAVYHDNIENRETNFQTIFAQMICSYGGHSCEKRFYNQEGSWGISSDLQHVTHSTRMLIEVMGLGHNTGAKSVTNIPKGQVEELAKNIEKDRDIFTTNALLISDMITHAYEDFNKMFTEKYSSRVGTGDCIIHGEDFAQELHEWKSNLSEAQKERLKKLDESILTIMDMTRDGKKVPDKYTERYRPKLERSGNEITFTGKSGIQI